MRRGGGPYFPAITPKQLIASPDGWFAGVQDPVGYEVDGTTYIAWVNGSSGDVKVAAYDHATKALGTPFVLHAALGGDNGNPDIHGNPSVWVRPDGKIVCGYSAHHGNTPLVRISTNPNDVSAFASEQVIGSTDSVTYVSLFYLSDTSTLHMFYRSLSGGSGRLAMRTSTDDGASWSGRTLVFSNGKNVYRRMWSDWTGRIELLITDTDRSDADPSSLYHGFYDGTWKRSDGTSAGTLPFDQTDLTLIQDDSGGPVNPLGIYRDPSGVIAAAMFVYSSGTNIVKVGRWEGSSWTVETVADTNGLFSSNRFNAGAALVDADTLYLCKKVGSIFELWRYVRAGPDDWQGTAVTSSSASNNGRVERVAFGGVLPVVWGRGTYTSDLSWATALYGLTN